MAGCDGESAELQPIGTAAGGSELTDRMATRSPQPLLRVAPAHSARDQRLARGEALLAVDWQARPPVPGALGPHFDRPACVGCHVEGVGYPEGLDAESPPIARLLDPVDIAAMGGQVSTAAIPGLLPQGRLVIEWEWQTGQFDDGTAYRLRRPRPRIVSASGDGLALSGPIGLRVAPALFGWGLLERVPEAFLRNLADPTDRNGDGISGRLSRVIDRAAGKPAVGRFGWKAEQPTLRQQTAAALFHDMGITTRLFPGPGCAPARRACEPELDDHRLDLLVRAQRYLAVPDRRRREAPETLRGRQVFERLGCPACHLPVMVTRDDGETAFADQVFWPYSDLLLHDLGAGLSDPPLGPDDPRAREWRTAPLWGIGLMTERYPKRGLLHDGRARDPMEAILWHGGEAAAARARTLALDAAARADLMAFITSL